MYKTGRGGSEGEAPDEWTGGDESENRGAAGRNEG